MAHNPWWLSQWNSRIALSNDPVFNNFCYPLLGLKNSLIFLRSSWKIILAIENQESEMQSKVISHIFQISTLLSTIIQSFNW